MGLDDWSESKTGGVGQGLRSARGRNSRNQDHGLGRRNRHRSHCLDGSVDGRGSNRCGDDGLIGGIVADSACWRGHRGWADWGQLRCPIVVADTVVVVVVGFGDVVVADALVAV